MGAQFQRIGLDTELTKIIMYNLYYIIIIICIRFIKKDKGKVQESKKVHGYNLNIQNCQRCKAKKFLTFEAF